MEITIKELYSSPEVEIMEADVQTVVCTISAGQLEDYTGNSWDDE